MKLNDCVLLYDSQRRPLNSLERSKLSKLYPYYGAQGVVDYVDNFAFDGDFVLVAEDGNNLLSREQGIATMANGRFWVSNHAHVLQTKPGVLLKWLFYWLNYTDLRRYVTGSAQPKLSQSSLLNIDIDVPPLPIQRHIVDIRRKRL
jgi:type I restriction enzyme, S subunit